MKYIPNILTLFRIILVPILIMTFFSSLENAMIWSLFIFLLAGLTDLLDGYLARKYQVISQLGTVLDPLADKLMLLGTLTCLYLGNYLPIAIVVIMYIKEGTMLTLGLVMYFKKTRVVIPSNIFGKSATVLFTIAIIVTFLYPSGSIHLTLLIGAVLLKLVAFSSYIRHYRKNYL